jgi:hypothetical protein
LLCQNSVCISGYGNYFEVYWREAEGLHNLYASPNIIWAIISRRMRWAIQVARMGEMRIIYNCLVGKPEGRRPPGRRKRRREDNIRMDLREIG